MGFGSASQVTSTTPWGYAQPYLLDIMGKAQNLYGATSPQFANPASNFGYGQTTGALGSAINGTNSLGSLSASLTPGVGSAISSELSGIPDYTAVKNALDAANAQTWNSFNNTEIPQLNQRASFLGNPSGAIKDLNWATSQIGNNMDLNAQQAYLGQYDNALARQANAAALGTNIAQTAGQQSLQGAALYPTIAQMPQQNLADYANIISGTGGKFGSGSTSINPSGAATAANVIGGLTAGAGLLGQLTGATPATGGLIGKVGSLFGSGSTAGIGTGATAASNAAASQIGTAVAPTVASDSAGIAAGNDAWLASQPAATSSGISGGLGAGAVDAGTVGGTAAGDAGLSSVGVDAATADPSIVGLGGTEAGSSGAAASSSSGLSSGAGAAAAFAPLAITAELAMHTHAVQLGDKYWQGFKNPTGSYGTPGTYTQNFLQLAEGINRGDIPPDYLVNQYPGLYQAAAQMRQLQSGPMSAYWGTGGNGANVSRLRA